MTADWIASLKFARRELRGGLGGFRAFLACLALGVAAIAAVGSAAAAVAAALRADAAQILGGDVDIRIVHREATAEQLAWIRARADAVSRVSDMRAMARRPDGRAALVELKAVDEVYPLYGRVETEPARPLQELLAGDGAVIERALGPRLGLAVGDRITIGAAELTVRAVVLREPDRAVNGIDFGPRVLISRDSLARTGLAQPGALIDHHHRVKLAAERVPAFIADLTAAFPEAGWRVRAASEASPGLARLVDRISLFLTLVGLTALLVGGVGVANAVDGHLAGRMGVIATLKCLGAPAPVVFRTYLLVVLALATLGVALGLGFGALAPWALAAAFGDALPVPIRVGIYPAPLALAAVFGLLTALAAALWPLGRARAIPAATLFRDVVAPASARPAAGVVALLAATLAALAGLAIATAQDKTLAAAFVAGSAATFAALRLIAAGVVRLARRLPPPADLRLKLALDGVRRPGAPTAAVLVSLGLGLTVLVMVTSIQGNLALQVAERIPERAPTHFLVDIQPDQIGPAAAAVRALPGVTRLDSVPSLRGRIVALNGVPIEQAAVAQEARWALDNDRGMTYAAAQPEGAVVTAGDWWPADYAGPPLVSFDARLAAGMGLKVGDTITVNVLGRTVEARIANLRLIDWQSLAINFTLIFAPGLLESAPHTHIATIYGDEAAGDALLTLLARDFPNVTAVRVKDALAAAGVILAGIGQAADVTAGVTVLAGVLVLAGALAAGLQRRRREAVMLKVLGAARRDLVLAAAAEFALLGLIAAVVAALLGQAAAAGVTMLAMRAEWTPLPGTLAAISAGALVIVVTMGLAGTWRALGQRPAPALRAG